MTLPEKRFSLALLEEALSMIRSHLDAGGGQTIFKISRVALAFRVEALNRGIGKLTNRTVRDGPFVGMRYIEKASGSTYTPKLLGTYEAEIAHLFTDLDRYTTFIDIGCAEGYYAVGVAFRAPHIRVIAFDKSPKALERAQALANLNGLSDRIAFHDAFDRTVCGDLDAAKTLVLIDIEGAELELLPTLLRTDLIEATFVVEAHELMDTHTEAAVISSLELSHTIERISQTSRTPETIPDIRELNQLDRFLCVWEGRNTDSWIIARPK